MMKTGKRKYHPDVTFAFDLWPSCPHMRFTSLLSSSISLPFRFRWWTDLHMILSFFNPKKLEPYAHPGWDSFRAGGVLL